MAKRSEEEKKLIMLSARQLEDLWREKEFYRVIPPGIHLAIDSIPFFEYAGKRDEEARVIHREILRAFKRLRNGEIGIEDDSLSRMAYRIKKFFQKTNSVLLYSRYKLIEAKKEGVDSNRAKMISVATRVLYRHLRKREIHSRN